MEGRDEEGRQPDAEGGSPPLSRKVTARLGWDDLVFTDETRRQLDEIGARWRLRGELLDEWGFRRRLKSEGLICLFAGEPGTGKTEAASVISHALGLELYQVHTPGLLSKYIGETERNIDRILSATERGTARLALVFDEAEALFSKRVDAKGSGEIAHNSQIGLLLSRLERYDGLAFLTTNKPSMIDPAFKRRFHVFVEFDLPGPKERAQILRLALAAAPVAPDMKFTLLDREELAGGSIQNIALTAAFLARQERAPMITNAHLRAAVEREWHKMGRLVFGG